MVATRAAKAVIVYCASLARMWVLRVLRVISIPRAIIAGAAAM
jgi:hypothetical protein